MACPAVFEMIAAACAEALEVKVGKAAQTMLM